MEFEVFNGDLRVRDVVIVLLLFEVEVDEVLGRENMACGIIRRRKES